MITKPFQIKKKKKKKNQFYDSNTIVRGIKGSKTPKEYLR